MNRIRVETRDAIGTITLARPEQRNALDRETTDELVSATRQLEGDERVRVIVVRGEGNDFCAGADLHALRVMLDKPLEVHEADARALGNVFLALHYCVKPTVAVVRGKALAGGAGLATSCDMIVAHENAVFAYPEVAIGFVPAMAMALLVRCVGERVAFDLVSTGRRVTAAEGERLGLVSRCFAENEFESSTAELITSLSKTPPLAMAATKKLLHELRTLSVAEGIERAIHVNAAARSTDDFKRGVLRFTDRKADS